jgi:hypothetical protein
MQNLRSFVGAAALGLTLSSVVAGCAVDDEDLHHWESTLDGPRKLNAVLSHDKYGWALRTEAAMSLVRMKTRGGQRIGLETLIAGFKAADGSREGGLQQLAPDARARIVQGLTPLLVEQMKQPLPARAADGTQPPEPSIPYKDAAFALLSSEATLVSDETVKTALRNALLSWVQSNFEARIDNPAQQFGVEQVMRHPLFGAAAVKPLSHLVREDGPKNDRLVALISDLGDADAKKAAGEALVALAKRIDSPEWIQKQKPLVEARNAKTNEKPTPEEFKNQVSRYQEQELEKVFANIKRLGGAHVVDFALSYAADKSRATEARIRAIASVEGRLDKNSTAQLERIFDLVKDDKLESDDKRVKDERGNFRNLGDKLRALALARLGEFPKEQFVPKLYTLFEGKKWQLRLDAARLVLRTMNTKDLGEFMRHLPQSERTPMSLSEPIAYAAHVNEMPGPPAAREALKPYLTSRELGPRLVAISSFYEGKKSDLGALSDLENDRTSVPKCKDADACGWKCRVPKSPGSKETDEKVIETVGDYVKYCVVPSLK